MITIIGSVTMCLQVSLEIPVRLGRPCDANLHGNTLPPEGVALPRSSLPLPGALVQCHLVRLACGWAGFLSFCYLIALEVRPVALEVRLVARLPRIVEGRLLPQDCSFRITSPSICPGV